MTKSSKEYILKSTNYKRMNLYDVIEKHEAYFRKVALSNDLKLYGKTDIKKIKEALNITNYDTNTKVNKAYEILSSGGSIDDVKDYLKSERCSEKTIDSYISHAKNKLKSVFGESKDTIVSLHLSRYDKIYRDHINYSLDNLSHLNVPLNVKNAILCSKYIIAMEALFAKEKVLGFHSKNFIIEVNSFKKAKEDRFEDKLDFSQLLLEEQIELMNFIKKCKGVSYLKEEADFVDFEDVVDQKEDQLKVETSNIEKTKVIKFKTIIEAKPNPLEELKRKLQEKIDNK